MKRAFAIAALVAVVCAGRAQTANVSIIGHNIHSGGQAQAAADHIEYLLNLTPQKIMVLCNEANYARQNFTLPYSGWQHNWPSSPFEGRGNPLFTRTAAATVLASWTEVMTERWTFNGNDRDPRIYTVVKAQLVSDPWVQFHCVNVHFPPATGTNGTSRQESIDRLIELSAEMPVLPLIICGDFNYNETDARQKIAVPIGGKLYSNANVDHIILRDGQQVKFGPTVNVTRLGQFISDHTAVRYNFSFTQSTGVEDWNLY